MPEEKEPQQEPTEKMAMPSLAMLELVMAETIGLAMHNAVAAQQNAQLLNTAIVSEAVNRILSVNKQKEILIVPAANNSNAKNKKTAAISKKTKSKKPVKQ
jgi:hypothetical protein